MSQPVEISPASQSNWKKELADAETSVARLLERLNLSEHLNRADLQPDFKCMVTASYLSRMKQGDINDPLLLQVLPLRQERQPQLQTQGLLDPVGDIDAQVSQGVLHKYKGRALLISTGACAIHCRYCFRRHYPYPQRSYSNKLLQATVDYLRQNVDIDEVILSGGDPLVLDNEKLDGLIKELETIDHIHSLRIHTRLPVVLPSRIDSRLIQLLASTRFKVVMVIHANHANELTYEVQTRLLELHQAGIVLLNQSVLLKGVNDDSPTLIALSKRLLQCNTLPYYLHSLDPVSGAMHFAVDKNDALSIKEELEKQLPGYLVPRLVEEIAGKQSKTAISRI